MRKRSLNYSLLSIILAVVYLPGFSQSQTDGKAINNIQTAVPFLLIAPDARSAGMGDAGVAISPDINAVHWNAAKLAFLEAPGGLATSYTPWLRKIVDDIDLGYLSGYYRLDSRNTIGGSIRYFSVGTLLFTQNESDPGTTYSPNEFAVDAVLSRKFGDRFSLATALRYIRSSMGSGAIGVDGVNAEPASALAADVSGYFRTGSMLFNRDAEFSLGFNFSNIGTKVNYNDGSNSYFLPANMKLGTAITLFPSTGNRFTLALDINKLLVPTSPIRDSEGNIIAGTDPDRSVPSALFSSFSDAPGGFSEEMREINYSLGGEYSYKNQFAFRGGYFYEHPTKGGRQYFTLGMGFKYDVLDMDIAYLIANQQRSPLANTLRFSVSVRFGSKK